jgi:predicted nucleic acid-binding protein
MRASYLDASAAVKLVIPEKGSNHLLAYFANRSGFHITPLCLAESLGVLKRKMLKCDLSRDEYFAACSTLLARVRSTRIDLDGVEMTDVGIFTKAEALARVHDLDLSDALQIISVKQGKFHKFSGPSQTVLITADKGLEKAAAEEGLKVWNCESGPAPWS